MAVPLLSQILLAACVVACAATEAARRKIYNIVTYPAAALGLVAAYAGGGSDALQLHALGMAVGVALPLLFFAGGAIGGGDVKLLGAVGALGGHPFIVYVLAYSLALGALAALGVLATRVGPWRGLRLAARLAAGAFVPVRLADDERAAARMPLPFGIAIALGTLAHLAALWSGA